MATTSARMQSAAQLNIRELGIEIAMSNENIDVRDNMRILWDVPILMDDGITLRGDVFLPMEAQR